MKPKAKWTFMVYMAGNNSLSGAAAVDLNELQAVGSTKEVNIAAFVKQVNQKVRRLIVGKGKDTKQDVLDAYTDAGAPQTVVDFVRWSVNEAPAEKYALILWSHGDGWVPDDIDQLYAKVRSASPPRDIRAMGKRKIGRSIFSTSVSTVLQLPTAMERAICSDDTTGHSLDTLELANILKAVQSNLGGPLELLGMDACLMSTLEVAYEILPYVKVVVGSEAAEPADGWPYQAVLSALNRSPDQSGATFGKSIVDAYRASYAGRKQLWPVTQCAVASSEIEKLAGCLDGLASALTAYLPDAWTRVIKAQSHAVFFENDLCDLASWCDAISTSADAPAVQLAAKEVRTLLGHGGGVLANCGLGSTVAKCGGVSLYLPSPLQSKISKYYADLKLSKNHAWYAFLQAYAQVVGS